MIISDLPAQNGYGVYPHEPLKRDVVRYRLNSARTSAWEYGVVLFDWRDPSGVHVINLRSGLVFKVNDVTDDIDII